LSTVTRPLVSLGFSDDALDDLADRIADRIVARLERADAQPAGEWLTLRQAADHLGIGYSTAKRYAADGTWPVEREGGRCYLRRADLDAWRIGSA
jgi:excisionase family DNA binding protein